MQNNVCTITFSDPCYITVPNPTDVNRENYIVALDQVLEGLFLPNIFF